MTLKIFTGLLFAAWLVYGCKKEKDCPNLQGTWLLTEYYDGTLHPVLDTSTLSEVLQIDSANHYISYSTRYHTKLNEGDLYCDKIFDANGAFFKKGSAAYYYLYQKR